MQPSLLPKFLPAVLAGSFCQLAKDIPANWHLGLAKLLTSSNFATQLLSAKPSLLSFLIHCAEVEKKLNRADYTSWLAKLLPSPQEITSEDELHLQLRLARQKAMLRLLWRDAQNPGDYQQAWQTCAEISYLAEELINFSLNWLENHLAAGWGKAYTEAASNSAQNTQEQLGVLALGKLGAGELNLSSDIDLIFSFPTHQGTTQGGRRNLAKDDYFIRLGQKLITALDKPTAEGRVFRVDMRLRPYGNAGALALSNNALLTYYQNHGRDWERYALIKAQPLTGSHSQELINDLRPFVYRRYIDFSALEALRDLKEKINQEVQQQGMQDNIKLGQGGIREVEFICQVFQLIRGGKDTQLQSTSIYQVLPLLSELGLLPKTATQQLFSAYTFLRDLENALQAMDDQQTHELPSCPEVQARLAWRLGKANWAEVLTTLNQHRQVVRQEFNALIAEPTQATSTNEEASSPAKLSLNTASLEADLTQLGYTQATAASQQIHTFLASKAVARMQPLGHKRLEELLPFLLVAASKTDQPCLALERSLWLIEAVLRRTAYLVLLKENPPALEQLVKLGAASPWVAELLAKMPILLDELLTPSQLYIQLSKPSLEQDLAQQLAHISWQDTEAQMEALRYFHHANLLRLAAADLLAQRPLMQVSDSLTFMAEVILQQVLNLAWQDLAQRHGAPVLANGQTASLENPGFVILGYGKLGGLELSYASDLDLVFLHLGHSSQLSQGERPLDSASWFSRLGQRIIHYLTTTTVSGQLYEVDMRLRPSGQSGLLVSSLEAFSHYQQNEAWTWEHQALVRARPIAGDANLAASFTQLRSQVLSQPRQLAKLQEEVLAMRQKILSENLPGFLSNSFCFKQAQGGVLDIEFLVQFLVLAFSQSYPEIHTYSDAMRQLDALAACQVLPVAEAEFLQQSFLAYRQALHQNALAKTPALGELKEWQPTAEKVRGVFEKYLKG